MAVVELDRPVDLTHSLQAVVPEIRRFKTRKALFGSEIWQQHGPELERVTNGLEYFRHPSTGQAPKRPFVRAVAWNIERGKRFPHVMNGLRNDLIRSADILILNEVDIGMARSGQRNIARLIADELKLHYVFGNHYLCLDMGNPRDTLELGRDGSVVNSGNDLLQEENRLGLHGNVIFSRWPILRAESVPLFETKDKFRSRSEKRFGVKKGIWADIESPLGMLTVAGVHLDSVASPLNRSKQLDDLLRRLTERGRTGPVLLGGDWNTSTYDAQSPWGLAKNLAIKFWRGGFRHAVPEYMRPYRIYDRPTFEVADRHGFNWRDFNNLDHSTGLYDVDDPEAANTVRDHVGMIGVKLLRWRLSPWSGKAPLKLDWFAGRGCRPAGPDPATGALAPMSFERYRPGGHKASDHDPILVDVKW